MRTVVLFALIQCAFGQQPVIQSIQNGASPVAVAPQMVVAIHGSNFAVQTTLASQPRRTIARFQAKNGVEPDQPAESDSNCRVAKRISPALNHLPLRLLRPWALACYI